MANLVPEMICGGCNSSYGAFALTYPYIYYACGPVVLIHDLSTHKTTESLQKHKSQVNCIAIIHNYIISGSTDKTLIVWENRQFLKQIQLSSSVIHLKASESYIISITSDGVLSIFNAEFDFVQKFNFKNNLQETCDVCSYNNFDYLCTGGADSRIHVYVNQGKGFLYVNSLEGHARNVRSMSFKVAEEGFWLASTGQDSYVRLWKFSKDLSVDSISSQGVYEVGDIKAKLDAVLTGHISLVSSVSWMDECILTCSHDFSVIVWHEDPNSMAWVPKVTFGQLGGNKNVFLGAQGVRGRVLAYTYSGGFYHWTENPEKWVAEKAPTGHYGSVTDLAVSSNYVLTSSLDQTCRLWGYSNSTWTECSRPMIHGYEINSITLSKSFLVSGADEKILRVFDVSISTSEILKTQGISIDGVARGSSQVLGLTTKSTLDIDLDFSNIIITEDVLNSYTLWPECYKLYGHGYELNVVTSSPQGDLIASACKSQTKDHAKVFVWDIATKQKIQELEFHSLSVTDMCFSSDGQFLLTVSRDRSWCLYELQGSYQYKISSQVHTRVIYTCCWSPDNLIFATGSRDKKLRIWNTNGEELHLFNFQNPVTASCFIDNHVIALGFENGEVHTVNIHTRTQLLAFRHGDLVTKLKYLSGKIYSISNDHTFRIYRLE